MSLTKYDLQFGTRQAKEYCRELEQQLQAHKEKEDKLRLGVKFIEDNLYVLIDKSKINNKSALNLETSNYYKLLDTIKILKQILDGSDE